MSTRAPGFKVLNPGLLTLVQDAGRFGYHRIGLTTGGPLDPLAFRWANRLCGNDLNAAALEISFGGLMLEAQSTLRLVLAGAETPLHINGIEREMWCTQAIKSGDLIEVGYSTNGCRSYLAITGGFKLVPCFGSVATVTRESLGGLNGGKLNQGDFLPCLACNEVNKLPTLRLAEKHRPRYTRHANLRVIPGYQQHAISRSQQRLFYNSEYRTTERSDRMGYRLEGRKIILSLKGILSEGICQGAVQVPPDGQPIVLLADRQTIGGYPKLGSVLSLDTAKLAQLTPGAKVKFEPITMEDAHNLLSLAKCLFERIAPEVPRKVH